MVKEQTKKQGGLKKLKLGHAKKIKKAAHPAYLMMGAGALLTIVMVVSWWHFVRNAPENIFWGAVSNSLQTTSFTKTVGQDDGQQTENQITVVHTAPEHLANGETRITQGGKSGTAIITENIGTPTTDYVRYKAIHTSQKSPEGKPLDFSKVVGVWGVAAQSSETTSGQLYNQNVLGVLPMANLPADKQRALVATMQQNKAYTFELQKVTYSGWAHRPTYIYSMHISPVPYITALKQFASDVGLTQLEGVNPKQYSQTATITAEAQIDGWTKQVKSLAFGNGRVEKFVSYGSTRPLMQPPTKAVSVDELQSRLQSIQ